MKALTKENWANLRNALLAVPIKARNVSWKEAVEMIDWILDGRNNLCPDVDVESGRFAVACDLCRDPISLEEDYVRHAITGTYVHYDCHHRSSVPIGEKPPGGKV